MHRRLVDAKLLAQALDGDGMLGLHNAKDLGIVRSSEFDPLAVIPPDILVRLRQEADIIVYLFCDKCGEKAEKRADFVQFGMSTDTGSGTDFQVSLMQGLQVIPSMSPKMCNFASINRNSQLKSK